MQLSYFFHIGALSSAAYPTIDIENAMIELTLLPPPELIEIEGFITEILGDIRHPINNSGHPMYRDSVKALDDLMAQADLLRESWLSN